MKRDKRLQEECKYMKAYKTPESSARVLLSDLFGSGRQEKQCSSTKMTLEHNSILAL